MTKQELYNEVNSRISSLTKEMENPPKDYVFYSNFVSKYKLKTIDDLLEIPYTEFAIATLYATYNEEESFEEFYNNFISFSSAYESLDNVAISDMCHFFRGFIQTGRSDILIKMFADQNKKRAVNEIKRVFTTEDAANEELVNTTRANIETLVINNGKYGWNLSLLIKYFKRSLRACMNVTETISVLKSIKESKRKGATSKELDRKDNIKGILKLCAGISECRKIQSDEWKKREAGLKSKIGVYKKFIKDMDAAFQKEGITNYANIIRDLDDDKLKVEFLKLVYQHNRIKYEAIDVEYESLSKNSLVNYLTILKNNGIKKDEVDLIKVSRNTCEDLEKMLKILNAIVGNKEIIIKIIETSDLENVMYFKELKTRGILSTKSFTEYYSIFDVNSDMRKILDKNIEVINNYEMDYTMFSKNPDILIDNTNLEENLETLDSYGLIGSLRNDKKYKFLKNEHIYKEIDKIIELGYEDLLIDDITLLNEKNWDRIYVLKSMGLKPETKSELLKYLRDDKFFVPDDKLHLYIEDATKYYDSLDIYYDTDMARIVKENANTDNTLSFNGVIISKNRVSRNITNKDFSINDLFRAIIKGSILSTEEIETIKSILKNKEYKLD